MGFLCSYAMLSFGVLSPKGVVSVIRLLAPWGQGHWLTFPCVTSPHTMPSTMPRTEMELGKRLLNKEMTLRSSNLTQRCPVFSTANQLGTVAVWSIVWVDHQKKADTNNTEKTSTLGLPKGRPGSHCNIGSSNSYSQTYTQCILNTY